LLRESKQLPELLPNNSCRKGFVSLLSNYRVSSTELSFTLVWADRLVPAAGGHPLSRARSAGHAHVCPQTGAAAGCLLEMAASSTPLPTRHTELRSICASASCVQAARNSLRSLLPPGGPSSSGIAERCSPVMIASWACSAGSSPRCMSWHSATSCYGVSTHLMGIIIESDSYNHRLQETSKIIESNHPPNTTMPTKPYPEVPHLVF